MGSPAFFFSKASANIRIRHSRTSEVFTVSPSLISFPKGFPYSIILTRLGRQRRFPLPWSVEETDACFIVGDHSAYVKFSDTGKSIAPGPDACKDRDLPTHCRR